MKRKILLTSILSIVMCFSLVCGATFALFTSEDNVNVALTSGKVEIEATVSECKYKSYDTEWASFTGDATFSTNGTVSIADGTVTLTNVVPGDGVSFKVNVVNTSNVTVKYRTVIKNTVDTDATLFNALEISINGADYIGVAATPWTTLDANVDGESFPVSVMFPDNLNGVEYMNKKCGFTITVQAIQGNANTIDEVFAQEDVTVDAGTASTTADTVVGNASATNAVVPEGTKLETGKTTLTLNVTEAPAANLGNFTLEGEDAIALNIEIPEVADDNTKAIVITLKGYFPDKPSTVAMLHEGVLMTAVPSVADVDSADEYYYDSTTGDIVFATDDFSNFTAVPNVKMISTEQELYDIAFNQGNRYAKINNVILANDITITKKIQVAKGRNALTVDLNGYKLTNTGSSEMFLTYAPLSIVSAKDGAELAIGKKTLVNSRSDLTIKNVKVIAEEGATYGTSVISNNAAGKLVLDNVDIVIDTFKTWGGTLISMNAGTYATLNDVTLTMDAVLTIIDGTGNVQPSGISFINGYGEQVTMSGCVFNIADAETGDPCKIVEKESSLGGSTIKYAIEKA